MSEQVTEDKQVGARRRLVVLLAVVAGVLLVAGAVLLLALTGDADDTGDTGDTSGTSGTDGTAGEQSLDETLDGVEQYDEQPSHTESDVDYEQTPPVGGAHDPVWLDCGVYDEPIRDENVVHDLEHGTVWITYDPDLPAEDVEALEDELPENGILSPYDDLPAPVVLTVWNAQLELTGADDPRLPVFVETFDDGVTAPEPGASCAGGAAADPRGAGVQA